MYGYALQNPGWYVDPRGEEFQGTLGGLEDGWGSLPKSNKCTCPQVPQQPPSCPLDDNIQSAWTSFNPFWFRNQVRNNGPWDYKQGGPQYQDFGNFNYGATGAALGLGMFFSDNFLLQQAGKAQIQAGTSTPNWGTPNSGPPFGDDPADQLQIRMGIQYFKCGCMK